MNPLIKKRIFYLLIGLLMLSACTQTAEEIQPITSENTVTPEFSNAVNETEDKTSEEPEVISETTDENDEEIDVSHSKETDPVYDIVFPQDKVNEITISLSTENWQAMMTDLEEYFSGSSNNDDRIGGNIGVDDENPIWVSADIEFESEVWQNVGFRFKGNSSLRSTWSSGDNKFPFKLDFDEFEDEYPEIEDQRFYGFKQLSFSSNFNDNSYLREKVAADIFREAGVPSAETAFYAVYLEVGDSVEYLGLYTAVEVVDDTVIETQFDDDDGNVYKPEGSCATFAQGNYDEECYDKETNQEEADYSDLQALLEALHANTRTTEPEQWRTNLEAVFNVEEFLDYLAVNTVIQNWDTYGTMTHNYYLYTDPTTGQINWIPWDNNESMQEGKNGGGGGARDRNRNSGISISLDEVNANWPLIRYLLDDDVYEAMYAEAVEYVIANVFTVENMLPIYDEFAALIEKYVEQEGGTQAINQMYAAVEQLKFHVAERVRLAEEYLAMVQ